MTRVALLGIGVLEAVVVLFHVLGVQETPNWRWPWRNGRAWPLYPAMAAAAVPLVAGVWAQRRGGAMGRRAALAGVLLSVVGFQWVGQIAATDPPGWLRPCAIVEDRVCSSYWSDARNLERSGQTARQILQNYPLLMRGFYQHSQEKPPGPVLFYLMLFRLFGTSRHVASAVGAGVIALATAAGVPATYLLARTMLGDREAAFSAAVLYAVTPSVIVVFPVFDACYPAVVCGLALLSIFAVRTGRWRYGVGLGLAVTGVSLFVYNLLVMGTFLLGVMCVESGRAGGIRWRRLGAQVVLAGMTIAGVYAALWLVSGFDPIGTFRAAVRIQDQVNVAAHRPYPRTIVYDFFDFLFGTGRMLALLAVVGVSGAVMGERGEPGELRVPDEEWRAGWFLRLCLLQILVVGGTGLLRGETARVWCFLVPLVAIPAGRLLASWPPRWRYAALGVQAMLMLFMVQNVEFNSLSLPGS
jgi:hypothetical protein